MYKLRYKEDDTIEVGLDEAGRGCLFGRLYVGAVIFTNDTNDMFDHGVMLNEIKDSKLLSKRKRAILYDYVKECALDTAVTFSNVDEIDRLNILRADLAAMHRALDSLQIPAERILVDGDHWTPYKDTEGYAIIDGDAKYLPIAAAGILAKVSRDRWVESILIEHPEWDDMYGLNSNMGYGTTKHMSGIEKYGVTSEHRRSFAPVRRALGLPEKVKMSKQWLGSNNES